MVTFVRIGFNRETFRGAAKQVNHDARSPECQLLLRIKKLPKWFRRQFINLVLRFDLRNFCSGEVARNQTPPILLADQYQSNIEKGADFWNP